MLICWLPLQKLGYEVSWKEGVILWFGALRGVIGLALALITLETTFDDNHTKESKADTEFKLRLFSYIFCFCFSWCFECAHHPENADSFYRCYLHFLNWLSGPFFYFFYFFLRFTLSRWAFEKKYFFLGNSHFKKN